jgi:predicted dehydrogenase
MRKGTRPAPTTGECSASSSGPTGTVNIGVIGPGGMGTGHIQAFLEFAAKGEEKVRIIAVAEVEQKRRENAKRLCDEAQGSDSCTAYLDYRELIEHPGLHGVLIAAPEHWHAKMAEDAIAAGKDVYCEKPMTLRLEEALRLREVQLANPDILLQVGTQMMQLPRYQAAKKLIAEGRIGKPVSSQTSYCRNSKDGEWLYYAIEDHWKPGETLDWKKWCGPLGERPWSPHVYARWRRYRDTSTGIIGDLLVHQITPLMMAIDQGWPTRVVATGGHYIDKAMENHDQVNIEVEFERGHSMTVAGSTCNEHGLETLIRGHEANLFLNGANVLLRPERLFADEIIEETVLCADIGNDQHAHRKNWLACIRSRQKPLADVELGTQVMVVVDLATRSLWDGKAYRFDPKTLRASPA